MHCERGPVLLPPLPAILGPIEVLDSVRVLQSCGQLRVDAGGQSRIIAETRPDPIAGGRRDAGVVARRLGFEPRHIEATGLLDLRGQDARAQDTAGCVHLQVVVPDRQEALRVAEHLARRVISVVGPVDAGEEALVVAGAKQAYARVGLRTSELRQLRVGDVAPHPEAEQRRFPMPSCAGHGVLVTSSPCALSQGPRLRRGSALLAHAGPPSGSLYAMRYTKRAPLPTPAVR